MRKGTAHSVGIFCAKQNETLIDLNNFIKGQIATGAKLYINCSSARERYISNRTIYTATHFL